MVAWLDLVGQDFLSAVCMTLGLLAMRVRTSTVQLATGQLSRACLVQREVGEEDAAGRQRLVKR